MTVDEEDFERRLAKSKASLLAVEVDVPTTQQLTRRRAARLVRRIRIVLCVSTVLLVAGVWKLASDSDQERTLSATVESTNQNAVVEAPTSLETVEEPSTSTLSPATEPPVQTISTSLVVPPPDISADLETPLCRDLAPLVDGLVSDPRLVPVGARTRKSPGQPDVACEILYAVPGQSPEVLIGRLLPSLGAIPPDCIPCNTTGDADEVTVTWRTGSTAFIDPTGADGAGVSQDASVLVDRIDGTFLYVATYGRPNADVSLAIARAFDQRLG